MDDRIADLTAWLLLACFVWALSKMGTPPLDNVACRPEPVAASWDAGAVDDVLSKYTTPKACPV